MKTKIRIVSQLYILGLVVGTMSLAGAARAETTPSGDGSSLSAKDKTFMKKAAKGGMMEVAMGKMAEQNAQSDDVKSFGKRMVTDHSKANDELKSIAFKKGSPTSEQRAQRQMDFRQNLHGHDDQGPRKGPG